MAPTTRGMRARAAASADRIPLDALFKVLLLLSTKDLCPLRAVCRSWRNLISDKVFIAVHAACHKGRLFLAEFRGDMMHAVYVVGLASNVRKRVVLAGTAGSGGGSSLHQLIRMCSELACFASYQYLNNRCLLLNPATGAVQLFNEKPAVKHRNNGVKCIGTFFALGRVRSTGEHKVLRIMDRGSFAQSVAHRQLFEVFTINGTGTNHGQWRAQQNPTHFVEELSGTVVDGAVYFLTGRLYDGVRNNMIPADYILSFDLGREEWRRELQGPISSNVGAMEASPPVKRHQVALAELKGSLVVADHRQYPIFIDLWFLDDFGNGHWMKEYHIQTESVTFPSHDYHLKPLFVLDDGRLVVYLGSIEWLLICDPGTNNFESMHIRRLDSIARYTGNLLSLEHAG